MLVSMKELQKLQRDISESELLTLNQQLKDSKLMYYALEANGIAHFIKGKDKALWLLARWTERGTELVTFPDGEKLRSIPLTRIERFGLALDSKYFHAVLHGFEGNLKAEGQLIDGRNIYYLETKPEELVTEVELRNPEEEQQKEYTIDSKIVALCRDSTVRRLLDLSGVSLSLNERARIARTIQRALAKEYDIPMEEVL